QPVGSTADVTSDLDIFVLNAAGQVVASSQSNNLATHAPFEAIGNLPVGSYTVVVRVVSGSDPGHLEFLQFGSGANFTVSQQFGSAGGTSYPTSFGHLTAQNAIGVGAVPWWAASPFLSQTPLQSEPFSSTGPALSVFNPDGSSKGTPQLVQAPVVSGPDG